jgi:beta-mannosidase
MSERLLRTQIEPRRWSLASIAAGGRPDEIPGTEWKPAIVPGTVAANLARSKALPDPYVDDNIRQFAWIDDRDWWYRCEFEPPSIGEGWRLRMVCEGLTVGAELWVNDQAIGSSANMWIPFAADLSSHILPGVNEFLVRFPSTAGLLETDGAWAGAMRRQPGAHLRTAQCLYGWDFVPRLPAVGIWRSIALWIERQIAIEELGVKSAVNVDERSASVNLSLDVESLSPAGCAVEVEWSIRRDGEVVLERQTSYEIRGADHAQLTAEFQLDGVDLWWPVGYGTPTLYEGSAVVTARGYKPCRIRKAIGFRTVELTEEPDPHGRSFSFKINGRGVFAKGANWTPPDLLNLDGAPDRTDWLVDLAVDAGMNMIRVWGGGIYGAERLYDRCDEAGLLVWQDFMYACSAYPDHDDPFVENARREAEWAVTSLQHHPSIVAWCGNNENEWIYSRLPPADRPVPEVPGAALFTDVLPEVCARLDGTRPYRRSTPFGGSRPNSPTEGTQHYYTVGLGVDDEGRFDFHWDRFGPEGYAAAPGRFVAEFGAYVGVPEPEAIDEYLSVGERRVDSASWRLHLPRIGHWPVTFQQIVDYQLTHLLGVLPQALDWEAYQAHARLVQGEALRIGFEAFRRNKPTTSGALMWSLNGVWPAADWAIVDHRTVAKPAYWFTKRALAPTLVSLDRSTDGVDAWVVHDGLDQLDGLLRLEYGDLATGRMWESEASVSIDPEVPLLASRVAWSGLPIPPSGQSYVAASLWLDGTCLSRAVTPRRSIRSVHLPRATLHAELVDTSRSVARVRISTDVFAFAVRLACYGATFSDNYFHMTPGEDREIDIDLNRILVRQCIVSALNGAASEPIRFAELGITRPMTGDLLRR